MAVEDHISGSKTAQHTYQRSRVKTELNWAAVGTARLGFVLDLRLVCIWILPFGVCAWRHCHDD
jgi:hypothetical protein